jgi:hypothetical protein
MGGHLPSPDASSEQPDALEPHHLARSCFLLAAGPPCRRYRWAMGASPPSARVCLLAWIHRIDGFSELTSLEFWIPDPNSWDSICQVRPPIPKPQIKRRGEGRERKFITQLGTHAVRRGRGRVSSQLVFSHLWGTDMSYRFKLTKELGAGSKDMYN